MGFEGDPQFGPHMMPREVIRCNFFQSGLVTIKTKKHFLTSGLNWGTISTLIIEIFLLFLLNCEEYDRSDGFTFDYELNGRSFGS